jgi:iron complex transport system ATP-binding protein
MINMQEVSWKREKRWILQDISWQVQPNEHWALVGLNGSGKTTLLNMVNGYIWPTHGEISVLGHRFGEVDLFELRKQIGWVSSSLQQQLHGNDLAESIVLSGKNASIRLFEKPHSQDYEEAHQLMERFGCLELRQQPYATLSQGQKQKILIARALMAKPRLLIFDEPCTGLDLITREQVLQMIQQIAKEPDAPTMIYVTHYIDEILPCFSHTLLLRDGQVYKKGRTDQILNTDVLSDFFQVPLTMHKQGERRWIVMEQPVTK